MNEIILLAVSAAFAVPADSVRYLAHGDSYTIGEHVAAAERWPVQLVDLLRGTGVAIADPDVIATTGWTTDELAAGISTRAPTGPYALVSLLIGVNNQYRGGDATRYRAEFRALLSQAIGFAGGDARRVVVVSIPDWGVTRFAEGRDRAHIGREIDQFNAIARDEAGRGGAAWLDITPLSREPHDDWLAGDGLHPSGAQYAAWARLALPAARRALGAQ